MSDSLLGRVRKNLAAPKPGPQHLKYRSVIPLRERIWDVLRLPKAVPTDSPGLNRGQRRLLTLAAIVLVPSLTAWGLYNYTAAAPARSAKAFQEGVTASVSGNTELAIKLFTQAISTWPQNSKAYFERGNAYNNATQAPEAKKDWSKAIELDPSFAPAYVARGTQYRIEGDAQKALADLDHAIRLAPSVEAYYQRGQIFSGLGDMTKAVEAYDQAIATMRDAPYVYRARSAARKAMGDTSGYEVDRDTAEKLEGYQVRP